MLPNLSGAKFDILGENGKFCTHTETLCPGGNNVLKRFFFFSESLERALLVEYACQMKSLSHMVKKL